MEAFAAFELDFAEEESAFAGGDEDAVAVDSEDFSGFAPGSAGEDGLKNFEHTEVAFFWDPAVGTGPWGHGSDVAIESALGLGPIEVAVLFDQFFCVGCFLIVLWNPVAFAAMEKVESFHEDGGGKCGDFVVQGSGGVRAADGDFFLKKKVAGIEAFVHPHDGQACFGITLAEGCLNAGGSAVFREKGGVDVEAGKLGKIENRFFEDLTVGEDDNDVGLQVFELGETGRGVDFLRLVNGEMEFEGFLFDGGRLKALGASGGFIRLGDDADDGGFRALDQSSQGGNSNFSGAKKYNTHTSATASFALYRRQERVSKCCRMERSTS